MKRRIGILTSGGDCPGLNACIRGVARAVVPGHVQRGGAPSAYDRMLSTVFGVHAAQLIAAENYGQAVAMVGNTVSHNPLSEVAGKTKFVPADAQAVRAARSMGISLGD